MKSRIIDAIGGDIGKALSDVVGAIDSGNKEANADQGWVSALARSGVVERLPQLLANVNNEIDNLIEDLVYGCCRLVINVNEPIDFDSLHAIDVMRLRNLIIESAELQELFDAEKNCFLGVWKNVLSLLNTTGTDQAPSTSDAGGQDSNTPSPTATTGDQPN